MARIKRITQINLIRVIGLIRVISDIRLLVRMLVLPDFNLKSNIVKIALTKHCRRYVKK